MRIDPSSIRLSTLPQGDVDGARTEAAHEDRGFSQMLKDAIGQVNKRIVEADGLSQRLAMGEHLDIAQVMSAMAKADISFRLLLQVRNKALNAYEEIMRMQF